MQLVGDHAKLWAHGNYQGDELLISSHGSVSVASSLFGQRYFTVPAGTAMLFYAPHGDALIDPGIAVARNDVPCWEAYAEGAMCPDYVLRKYQGRHGNTDETYESIQQMIDAMARNRATEGRIRNLLLRQGRPAPHTPEMRKNIDVLTIRYRRFQLAPNLSEIMADLASMGLHYSVIHCCFCRCPYLGGGSHNVQANYHRGL